MLGTAPISFLRKFPSQWGWCASRYFRRCVTIMARHCNMLLHTLCLRNACDTEKIGSLLGQRDTNRLLAGGWLPLWKVTWPTSKLANKWRKCRLCWDLWLSSGLLRFPFNSCQVMVSLLLKLMKFTKLGSHFVYSGSRNIPWPEFLDGVAMQASLQFTFDRSQIHSNFFDAAEASTCQVRVVWKSKGPNPG